MRSPARAAPTVFGRLLRGCACGRGGSVGGLPKPVDLALLVLVKRCNVAMALFAIVMFIGVLPREGRVGSWMRPVRSEISIIACILCAGHVIGYAASYVPRALAGALVNPFVLAAWWRPLS